MCRLERGGPDLDARETQQVGRKRPDGTRAEVMELHAIGKPCCSAFTASDPEK